MNIKEAYSQYLSSAREIAFLQAKEEDTARAFQKHYEARDFLAEKLAIEYEEKRGHAVLVSETNPTWGRPSWDWLNHFILRRAKKTTS